MPENPNLEQAQLFLHLHLHPRTESGFCRRCRSRQHSRSSCIAFNTIYWISSKMIGNSFCSHELQPVISETHPVDMWWVIFLKSGTSTVYFSNSSGSLIWTSHLPEVWNFNLNRLLFSQTHMVNGSLIWTSNLPEVWNLNQLFLKLIRFISLSLILEERSMSEVKIIYCPITYLSHIYPGGSIGCPYFSSVSSINWHE